MAGNVLYVNTDSYIPKSVFLEYRFLVDEYYSKNRSYKAKSL